MKTPTAMAFGEEPTEKVVSIDHRRWKQHCNGLYKCRWQREFSIWHRTGSYPAGSSQIQGSIRQMASVMGNPHAFDHQRKCDGLAATAINGVALDQDFTGLGVIVILHPVFIIRHIIAGRHGKDVGRYNYRAYTEHT
jgi:hypothetical protein